MKKYRLKKLRAKGQIRGQRVPIAIAQSAKLVDRDEDVNGSRGDWIEGCAGVMAGSTDHEILMGFRDIVAKYSP